MAQKLTDLLQLFSDMSAEEQLEHVRAIRKRRYVERPGAARRKVAKHKPAMTKAKNLLDKLSAADLKRLLAEGPPLGRGDEE